MVPLVERTLKLSPEAKILSTHGTITIEGESRIKSCHLISGLIITPLNGQKEISLPEVIMQNEIPDAWNQIPSRKDVEETPGYSMFAHEFPEKKDDWETVLLIDGKTRYRNLINGFQNKPKIKDLDSKDLIKQLYEQAAALILLWRGFVEL